MNLKWETRIISQFQQMVLKTKEINFEIGNKIT